MAFKSSILAVVATLVLLSLYFGMGFAADCYDTAKPPELTADNYYRAADPVCAGSTDSSSIQFGIDSQGRKLIIRATRTGPTRKYCWTAFSNIINQCVNAGKSGGKWDWKYAAEEEHYTIQGVRVF